MEKTHCYALIGDLKEIFDIVRLVDTERMEVCELHEDGSVTRGEYRCYSVWKRHERCRNCISARACATNQRLEKFEYVDGEIFYVVSKKITLDGREYALEVVAKTDDETLFEAYGKEKFAKSICRMNGKMYRDSLTGLLNRRYYDEQKGLLDHADAVALLDIDDFKRINDSYGHSVGDTVLQTIAKTVQGMVRNTDTVVRYGGDEFYLVFPEMKEDRFRDRLEGIRNRVQKMVIPEYPELQISISIGGCFHGGTENAPFEIADRNMYRAKKSAESHIVITNPMREGAES